MDIFTPRKVRLFFYFAHKSVKLYKNFSIFVHSLSC